MRRVLGVVAIDQEAMRLALPVTMCACQTDWHCSIVIVRTGSELCDCTITDLTLLKPGAKPFWVWNDVLDVGLETDDYIICYDAASVRREKRRIYGYE